MGWPPRNWAARNDLAGAIDNGLLGAAGIGDQGSGFDPGIQFGQAFDDPENRLREIQQVRLRGCFVGRQRLIDDLQRQRRANGVVRTDADDSSRETGFAEGQREGAADQANAKDCDSVHAHTASTPSGPPLGQ